MPSSYGFWKILATACAVIAILSTSCGGGGSTALVSVSTAGVSLSSITLTFGKQPVGTTSAAQTVILTNSGTAALQISGIAASGDFTQTNNCGASIAAGKNCTVSVVFTPTAMGARGGSLSISDNVPDGQNPVTLTGTGVATGSAVSLAPVGLIFSSQTVGTASGAQTVTVTNTGNTTLSITSVAVSGTSASNFALTNNCGSSVAADAICTINVTFKPSASGARTATLSIADNASGSPQTVSLSGTGTSSAAAPAAAVSLSPTSLAFGNQLTQTSAARAITVTNTGNATLSITSVAVSGTNADNFTQTNNCGSSVAADAICTITVTFKPSASGARTATLSIADNASGTPQTVSLSGTGTSSAAAPAAAVSLSPTSLAFGNQLTQTSAARAITLTNTGNATLSITSVAVSGTNAGNFTQTNNCGSSIAADDICTINVTFKPSASGTRTAALSIADNASGSPQTVSLSGTGTSSAAAPAAAVSLSPTSLAFGNQLIQTSAARAITLTNTGNTTLSITSLAVSGTNAGNFTQTNNCGSSVAADAGCTITITFKPSASGARTATLNIADNVTGSPQTVSLSGTGTSTGALAAVAATVSLSSTSLAFGSEPLQMTSAAQTVTLTNSGTATLIVSSIAFTGTNTTDFTEANTCSTSVAAGGNCTIAILFTPAAIGTRTASLSITDNATGSPQPVSLSGTGIHAVVLSWTVSPTAEVTGYNVYRGTTSGGESSTPLNSTPLSGTTYTDESVTSGATYYYFVTAVVSNQDTPSAASNEAVATIPSP